MGVEFVLFVCVCLFVFVFFFQAEDGIRDIGVTGVQTCALPIFDLIFSSFPFGITKDARGRTECSWENNFEKILDCL